MAVDAGKLLGAVPGERRNFVVALVVPSKTRDGGELDHEFWVAEALRVMGRLFGGATVVQGQGAWRDDAQGGAIKLEKVSTIESFMAKRIWHRKTVEELAVFLHRMGREARQGEIGLFVDGEYFPIREFNK